MSVAACKMYMMALLTSTVKVGSGCSHVKRVRSRLSIVHGNVSQDGISDSWIDYGVIQIEHACPGTIDRGRHIGQFLIPFLRHKFRRTHIVCQHGRHGELLDAVNVLQVSPKISSLERGG